MDNDKENQEDEAATSVSVASPRLSSVGASEDPAGSSRHHEQFHEPQAYELTSGHDHLHWGGVGRRVGQQPHDARSIASSAATRDDKSIFEEPGALDATEEGDEHGVEVEQVEEEEEEEEDGPVEITLTQVQGQLQDVHLRTESSNVDSAFTGISAGGSLAEMVDQLADQAMAGDLSPRLAAAAIRSATHGGIDTNSGVARETGDDSGDLPDSLLGHGSGGAGGSMEGMDTVQLEAPAQPVPLAAPAVAEAAPLPPTQEVQEAAVAPAAPQVQPSPVEEVLDTAAVDGAGAAVGHAAASELGEPDEVVANAEHPTGSHQTAEEAEGNAAADKVQPAAGVMPAAPHVAEEKGSESAIPPPSNGAAPIPEVAAAPATFEGQAADGAAGGEADGAEDGAAVVRTGSGATYHSRLMQQLTASASEDDLTVYTTESIVAPHDAVQPPSPGHAAAPQQATAAVTAAAAPSASAAAAPTGSAAAPESAPASRMQPLSIAAGDRDTAETAAAMAAINATGSSTGSATQTAGGGEAASQAGILFPPSWYDTFKGLLYMDGVDALGRPVVVINADAVPSNMKGSALVFVKAHLEPLVNQGDYVLVFTSGSAARLSTAFSMWLMGAYTSLPRPFRKNVKFIVLVRPSGFLRAVLGFMRPFVSRKAGRKVKQVQSVHDIPEATGGEVTVQSLGAAFAAEQLAAEPAPGGGSNEASP